VSTIQRTLAIIKPDAVAKGVMGQIITRIEQAGLKILAARLLHMAHEEAAGFYAVHRERPFFGSLCTFMTQGPCLTMVLEVEGKQNRVWKYERGMEQYFEFMLDGREMIAPLFTGERHFDEKQVKDMSDIEPGEGASWAIGAGAELRISARIEKRQAMIVRRGEVGLGNALDAVLIEQRLIVRDVEDCRHTGVSDPQLIIHART